MQTMFLIMQEEMFGVIYNYEIPRKKVFDHHILRIIAKISTNIYTVDFLPP